MLGIALGIREADLKRIDMNERGEPLNCLKEMFVKWLDHYNATWRELVKALLHPPLNASHVAKAVADKHTTTTTQS